MIIGNIEKQRRIQELAKNNTLSHALLISGPKGTSKYRFLENLAHLLLQEHKARPPALVKVDELYREGQTKIEDLLSSTFDQSHRKKDKKKTDTIGIDDIESFTHHLFETTESPYKIVLIRDIERFTIPASNKLLKILEEPPEKTLFFMTTSEEYKILPTIFSRVQKEIFSCIPKKELASHLPEHFSEEEKQTIVKLSAGRSEEFLKLIADNDYFASAQAQWNMLEVLEKMNVQEIFEKAEKMVKEPIESIITFFDNYTIVLQEQLTTWLSSHQKTKAMRCALLLQSIIKAQSDIMANGNKRLVLENLFLQIIEQ